MPDAVERGPVVADAEDLYRAIPIAAWWVGDPPRPSSAAFHNPSFSTNIASLMTVSQAVDHMTQVLHAPHGAIVAFNAGESKQLGFDPRQELDPAQPTNMAHANVYSDGGSSERKRRARRLVDKCWIVHQPSF